MAGEEDGVGDMAAVAERLRLVRAARRKFLNLWAIDQALVEPLLDRMAADLAPVEAPVDAGDDEVDDEVHDRPPPADKP